MIRSVIACKYYIDWTLAHWQVIIIFNKLSVFIELSSGRWDKIYINIGKEAFHIINMHMVNIDLTIMFRQSFKKLIVI